MKKLALQIDELRVDSFVTTSENIRRGGSVLGKELTVTNDETCLATCGYYCTAAAGTCGAFTCADATCANTRYGNATCDCGAYTPDCYDVSDWEFSCISVCLIGV